jgi:hypothetical protein
MPIIQIILVIFLFFALSRVFLRFRERKLSPVEFIFWTVLFLAAIVGVVLPDETTKIARLVGINRGVDFVIYLSIATLFYLVFRIYIMMENIRHEQTEIIRKIAIENQLPKGSKKK